MVTGIAGLALALPIAASAGSGTDRATGGGQVLIGSRGAGDTIAFTAQGTPDAASGQVQYADRTGGTGHGQNVLHGTVSCLRVQGNMAKMAGTWAQGGTFQLLVVDNGEGAMATDSDMITLQDGQDPTCDQENNDNDGQTALARGNAQVYDAP
jgi:hypothetical protein